MKKVYISVIILLPVLCGAASLFKEAKLSAFISDSTQVFKENIRRQFITDCEPLIILTGVENNEEYLYWAGDNINVSNYKIIADSERHNITMKAGTTILLKPHTKILRGNHYLARIEPCVPSCETAFEHDKFFTPNGDGINDFWKVRNLQNVKNIDIVIFDRYGKIIHTLKYPELGWDGKYNSTPVLANDYWFLMTYTDCYGYSRQYKSHFSLLR